MKYNDFKGKKLSALGYGCMRFPVFEDETVNEELTAKLVDEAIKNGVNYFDTAYMYHKYQSEVVIGKILKNYPRDSFYLATKYPGNMGQVRDRHPSEVLDEQLNKCGVDYFDFYLLHNVSDDNLELYFDEERGIIKYFLEQKEQGRIRHLGFSTHASVEALRKFLERYGDVMEFCQVQMNFVDWELQSAREKYDMLTERGIPVWVMEPVRGGRLAELPEEHEAKLKAIHPEYSIASWAFRWLMKLPNVKMILSGMTTPEQLSDNLKTFSDDTEFTDGEWELLLNIGKEMLGTVPCTACRYCCEVCPVGLDIPKLIAIYNEMLFSPGWGARQKIAELPEDKKPSACIGCGACADICPQRIDVPKTMADFAEFLEKLNK